MRPNNTYLLAESIFRYLIKEIAKNEDIRDFEWRNKLCRCRLNEYNNIYLKYNKYTFVCHLI